MSSRFRPHHLAAAGSLLLLASLAPGAAAYSILNGETFGGTVLFHWEKEVIPWTIDTIGVPGVDSVDFKEALEDALDSWEDLSCSTIDFDFEGFEGFDSDQGIHVTVETGSWDPTVGDALAYALPSPNGQGVIESVDVVFNAVEPEWSVADDPPFGFTDVQGVATHEFGHAIGMAHSRHQDATMFFSGGSVHLRTLEPDDENGACFLYPALPFTKGEACDYCLGHDNCKGDGVCLQITDGTYCGSPCTGATVCPNDDMSCYEITNATPQCAPDSGYCGPGGQQLPLGDFCWSHQTCQSGLCLVAGASEAYCSQECTSSCPSGFACFNGYCLLAGTEAYGQDCDKSSECQSGYCAHLTLLGKGKCSQLCGDQNQGKGCPDDNQCISSHTCVPPGYLGNGSPCYSHTECAGTWCVEQTCTEPCFNSSTCPTGTTCAGGWCAGLATGTACEAQSHCPPGVSCIIASSGQPGICAIECDPLKGASCIPGEVCEWITFDWKDDFTGLCVPESGGAGEGQACDPLSKPCETHLVCHLGLGSQTTCHKDCKLFANNLGCSTGETCIDPDLPDNPKRGLCAVEGGPIIEPEPEPEPEPDPVVEPDAGTEPDAGPGPGTEPGPDSGPTPGPGTQPDTPNPGITPEPTGTGSQIPVPANSGGGSSGLGCQGAANPAGGAGPWLFLGLVLVAAWRRRSAKLAAPG